MRKFVFSKKYQSNRYKMWARIDEKWDGMKFCLKFERNTGDPALLEILGTEWDLFFEVYRFKSGISKKFNSPHTPHFNMKNCLIFIFILFCTAVQAQTRDTTNADTRPMCQATTKAGTACKRHAVTPATFCNVHNPETPRCGAPTKAGAPCKRSVKSTGQHCAVHSTPKQ